LRTRTNLTIAAALVTIAGCGGGGGGHDRSSATAPISSTTPGGVTSGTTTPVTTATTPTNTGLTDTLVSSFGADEVVQVTAATGTTGNRWTTGNGPTDVANWGFDAYVANTLSQDVTVIDRLANNVATTIPVSDKKSSITGLSFIDDIFHPIIKPLVRPTGIAVTPLGTKAFSANLVNLTIIDTNTNLATKSIVGIAPLNITNLITNFSTAAQQFMAQPFPGLGMAKVACNNDFAVVSCMLTGKLMRVNARTDSVIDYVDVGRAPIGVAIAANKAYVACALSQETVVVDLVTGMVRARIRGGMLPIDVAAAKAEDRVYVANALSGDISVIDTAADIIVDTLPAGLSVTGLLSQLGITLPTGTSGGLSGALNGFLQGFTGGMTNPNSLGAAIAGGSGGLLSPANLINGVLTGFLAYMGVTQQALNALNLPALGLLSVSVANNPLYVCSADLLMGSLGVTQTQTRNVASMMGLAGLGPVDVSCVWTR
jgi:YVTN family beta-propeller protein